MKNRDRSLDEMEDLERRKSFDSSKKQQQTVLCLTNPTGFCLSFEEAFRPFIDESDLAQGHLATRIGCQKRYQQETDQPLAIAANNFEALAVSLPHV